MTFRGLLEGLPPRPQQRSNDYTWVLSLEPLVLKGQDKLPFRQQDWPVPIGYEPNPRRSWEFTYFKGLIGKDKQFAGPGQWATYDYPNPRGPEPDWRRSWEYSYNKNLIGKDKQFRGPGQWTTYDYPNPQPVTWYRDWSLTNLQESTLLPVPLRPFDWPLPGDPRPATSYRSWEFTYNPNLVGQDKLPNRQQDWPVPELRTDPGARRSWEYKYIPELIGQDKLPNRQQDYPNPTPVTWYKDWFVNLLQTTLTPVTTVGPLGVLSLQFDWPNPIAPPYWENYRQESYFVQVPLPPFAQLDWPITQPPLQFRDWSLNLLQNTLSIQVVQNPFFQTDWPNYRPVNWYQSWDYKYLPTLVGQDKLPNRQQDWPNPVPNFRIEQTWIKSLIPGVIQGPFNQRDWPLPYPVQWYKTWEEWYNLNLIGQDKLPNRQQDWPLPYPVSWYQDYRVNLLESTLFVPTVGPLGIVLNQYDWPVPRGQRANDYGYINFTVNIPPPPPPPPPPTGGGIYPAEFYRRAMELDREQKLHASAVELGRMGGKARLDTMSARQRSEFARNAAETRWRNR